MPVEFEDELGDALHAVADTFQPDDPHALVGAGHLRGRRLRRRRTVTVVAGTAALAAVAVGGVLAGGLVQGGGRTGGVAAAPERPKPAQPGKAATPAVTGKQVARIFAGLLPPGEVTGLVGYGPKDRPVPDALASAVFDDGSGPGLVEIDLQRPANPVEDCPRPAPAGTWCSVTHVHGGTLALFKGYEYPDHRSDVKEWMATFVTSDDAQIQLSQWNAPEEKGAPVSRPTPPLTVAQMTAMVTSAKWKPVLAGLPSTDRPQGDKGGAPGGAKAPQAKADAAAGNG
ncbi:hypothetical protein [Actinacidiphila paucisporea]|uniref:Uncharacterized protein n=1 Tax=Actinacidiphila paucisporea TaxID=310782 RepID=A0A1M7HYH6_9ACTN|nr:hypothetical protein [Actinacidiphila paucisporea]SHM33429.1 hypothetical protein SAMN05216499_11085 [Actinacidiphila paucisporea]